MTASDLVLFNGPIKTFDPALGTVTALALRDGRILAAGDADDVLAAVRPGYDVLDLQGRTALPGLCDAHIHLLWTGQVAAQVNLEGMDSLPEALGRIRDYAARLPADAWVQGYGWDHTRWGRWPTAEELDAVTDGRPAYLTRKDLHSAWCNSAALKLAGLADSSPDPNGGSLGRTEGRLNGMLYEDAMKVVSQVLAQPTQADNEQSLANLMDAMLAMGLTSAHAPEHGDCFAALSALYGRGTLGLRVLHHFRLPLLDAALEFGLRSGFGDEWLRIGSLKLFSDGSLGSQTAHMLAPYAGRLERDPDALGMPMFSPEELRALVQRASVAGISVTIHAIGDAANHHVLNAIAASQALPSQMIRPQHGATPDRMVVIPHRIEHAQILHPDDIRRFADLGVIASIQPIHATGDWEMAERMWGERCQNAYAWRRLMEAGAILACGSDAPVEAWNPWWGIHAAMTRQRRDNTPAGGWYPDQRLSLDETLWGYTVGPAIASGELHLKGTLTPGKLADVIVADRDLEATAAEDIHTVHVDYTFVGGVKVKERHS